MNIKQELEKMQIEVAQMEDKADHLSSKLDEVWWQLRDEIRKED